MPSSSRVEGTKKMKKTLQPSLRRETLTRRHGVTPRHVSITRCLPHFEAHSVYRTVYCPTLRRLMNKRLRRMPETAVVAYLNTAHSNALNEY